MAKQSSHTHILSPKGLTSSYIATATLMCIMICLTTSQFQSCTDLVDQWIQKPQKLPPMVFANSGKFLNDLGDYNNCIHQHSNDYIYITLSVVNKLASNYQYMGLCAPIECKEVILSNNYTADFQASLNEVYKNATNSTFEPFMGMILYSPEASQPQLDWTNYLVFMLIGTLVALGVIGSFLPSSSRSIPIRAIKSFSLKDNFSKIITVPTTTENENLLFLNGCRVLSIFWIVFGHDMWFRFINIRNWMDSRSILTTPGLVTLSPAAYFAVDMFFWIGGFLNTIGMLEQMKKKMPFIKYYIGCVVHRFIRIWPTYMIAILIFWKVAPFFGDGPIWSTFYKFSCECNDGGIFWNMFFIDNLADHGPSGLKYCFGWGWYLAVDFQLFLITPFLFFVYRKSKKMGWGLTFFLFMASVITAFIMIMVNEWRYPIPNPHLKPQPQFMDKFYYKSYIRASTYFMGIFAGFIYYEWKNENEKYIRIINSIKNSIPIRIVFYIIGFGLTQATIWIICPYQSGEEWSQLAQGFYNSLNRVVFLIGVYLCIFAAMFGVKNDPAKFILGHPFFSPLAKISFCIYLTHFIVIMNGTFSAKADLYFQLTASLYQIITDIFYSILLALFLSLVIESPTLGLQKIFLRGGGKKKKDVLVKQKEKQEVQNMSKNYGSSDLQEKLIKDFSDSSVVSSSSNRETLL